ncbi:MAG: TIGR01777 family oxidoreductase [Pseudomonadota bacterium]
MNTSIDTYLLALQLMAVQGCLGAFDTLYHHELKEALPRRPGARVELAIHALRSLLYSVLFIGLSAWAWHGAWAPVVMLLLSVEIGLTLWDFVVEDRTRLLPATERVTHTVLAMNGGAFVMLLALTMPQWLAQPSAVVWQPHGWLSVFLAVCGVGVGLSGLRDALAARGLKSVAGRGPAPAPARFGAPGQQVLVTGATGFIGGQLVAALLADGHQVTALARRPRHAAWLFGGQVRCIASMAALPASHRIDVVINLAGARILGWRWTAARRRVLLASRVGVTAAVVDWIARAEHKPRLMLSGSAIGYYGVQPRGDASVLTESAPPQPIFMSQLCRDWEAAAQAARAHGVAVACLRFGLVLGTEGALPMMLLPIKLGLGGPLGGGAQWLSWIHVHDVIGAIGHLMRQDGTRLDQAYNFTAPESLPQREFSRVAARGMGRPGFFPTPALPMRLMLGEQADLLLEGQRVAPARLLETGYSFAYPTMREALRSLA